MKRLFTSDFLNTEKELTTNFIDRQIFSLKVTIYLTFCFKMIFVIFNIFDGHKSPYLPTNAITIVVSCFPAFYFLRRNKLNYAKFFAYFPTVFIQALSSYYVLLEGLSYGNAELALLPYVAACIVFYNNSVVVWGVFMNLILFLTVKIARFNLYPVSAHELILDLTMSIIAYAMVIVLANLYKKDFYTLKDNNDKLLEQKQIIESQTERLKAINSTKDRLFSIIAHDLRSPLSSLKGVMQLLDNEYISKEEFSQLSKRLQQSVDNVHGMLENLLLWSLSQMDGIKPNIKPFDLNVVVDETVTLFKEVFIQKQIDLISNSFINSEALGDEYQIRTVLRNILNNAIKFTPENGQIAINGKIENHFINLKIMDTGVGIRKEDLALIFSNPKLNTGTAGEKGTGFGLFLCKELIEKNGGRIDINSEFGKGTTIEILLPLMLN